MPQDATSIVLDRARDTIARHRMLMAGEGVVVALSGGPDSVTLLAVLAALAPELRVRVHAAHLNHGLRAAESDRDEACARQVAARLGVTCTVDRIGLAVDSSNLEERAREARYAFLERVAGDQRCSKIATGHTRDDQAETVLMRILRGTGLDGLAGIRAVRDGRIIRPLLDCTRSQVMGFLEEQGLPYCEDSSNNDRRFLRNRIRHDVLPTLEASNPGLADRLSAGAAVAAAEADYLNRQLLPLLRTGRATGDGSLDLAVFAAVDAGLAGRLVRLWLRQTRGHLRQMSSAHIAAVLHIASAPRPNARVSLPMGAAVVREYGRLRFVIDAGATELFRPCLLTLGASMELPQGWILHSGLAEGRSIDSPRASLLYFAADAQLLDSPLLVRTARAGDRVQPLGMRGHKKLQDVFVDRKVPQLLRHSMPVVEADGEILWVPGLVRSARALVSTATIRTLWLLAQPAGIAGA